ncbi:hypothetical protein QOT17_002158 [Balamuthia mandrillaris]
MEGTTAEALPDTTFRIEKELGVLYSLFFATEEGQGEVVVLQCDNGGTGEVWRRAFGQAAVAHSTALLATSLTEFFSLMRTALEENNKDVKLRIHRNEADLVLHVVLMTSVEGLNKSFSLQLRLDTTSEEQRLLSIIRSLRQEVQELRQQRKAYLYKHKTEPFHTKSGEWTAVPSLDHLLLDCPNHSCDLKMTLTFSAYGQQHGGIRLVMNDGERVFGGHRGFGFDYVLPQSNVWTKRCIVQVLSGVPKGRNVFRLEVRSQAPEAPLQLHKGGEGEYSGTFILLEEL